MHPIAPKRKLDVLHLVGIIAGAIAGIAGGQQLASRPAPCPVCLECAPCPEVAVATPVDCEPPAAAPAVLP